MIQKKYLDMTIYPITLLSSLLCKGPGALMAIVSTSSVTVLMLTTGIKYTMSSDRQSFTLPQTLLWYCREVCILITLVLMEGNAGRSMFNMYETPLEIYKADIPTSVAL